MGVYTSYWGWVFLTNVEEKLNGGAYIDLLGKLYDS